MRKRITALSTVLILVLIASASAYANAPNSSTLNLWLNDSTANFGWPLRGRDILGYPLTENEISSLSPYSPVQDSYVGLEIYQLAMNNQKWPTGDPNNQFYKLSSIRANQSVAFRQAIACLIDRNELVLSPQYLGGNGYRLDVPYPPFHADYTDYVNYSASTTFTDNQGIMYDYDLSRAAWLLDNYGFTVNPKTGIRLDPATGKDLSPITFVVGYKDPLMVNVAKHIKNSLTSFGIPVSLNGVPMEIAQVWLMLGIYNLYLGSWALSPLPTHYYDLYSSDMYYGYGSSGSGYLALSPNYIGFCNNGTLFGPGHQDAEGFDYYARKLKYAATLEDGREAARDAGYLFLRFCASVPLFILIAKKLYQAGWAGEVINAGTVDAQWTGLVNSVGYGIDNYWSFANMANPSDPYSIDYGLRNGIGSPFAPRLNVLAYGTASPPNFQTPDVFLESAKALNLMYESMISVNAYTVGWTQNLTASDYVIGTWDSGLDLNAAKVTFTIRQNIRWHSINNMFTRTPIQGPELSLEDINFSFEYTQACGPRVAWNYPLVADFDHAELNTVDRKITVFYKHQSRWAAYWAGSLPILREATWGAGDGQIPDPVTESWRKLQRDYNPLGSDRNHDWIRDVWQDGTGTWQLSSFGSGLPVTFTADPWYYRSSSDIAGSIMQMFHEGGDVNYDGIVDMTDQLWVEAALGYSGDPNGPPIWSPVSGAYNSLCDLDHDGKVWLLDLVYTFVHFGLRPG